MSPESILAAISGPAGALIILAVAVYALVTAKLVVPGVIYRASEERNAMLEEEAEKTQDLLRKQADQLTDQRVANARLEAQVAHLSEQVERLTAEIESLRRQLKGSSP